MIEGIAFVAVLLHKSPQEVMTWRESEFALWSVKLFEQWQEQQVLAALIMAGMFFDSESVLSAREQAREKASISPKGKEEALARAARIATMPGSGGFGAPPG